MPKVHPPSLRYGATRSPKSALKRVGKGGAGWLVELLRLVCRHSRGPVSGAGESAYVRICSDMFAYVRFLAEKGGAGSPKEMQREECRIDARIVECTKFTIIPLFYSSQLEKGAVWGHTAYNAGRMAEGTEGLFTVFTSSGLSGTGGILARQAHI